MTEGSKQEPVFCEKHPSVRLTAPDCHVCHGEGMIEDREDFGGGYETCWGCSGNGWAPWLTCDWCDEECMEEQEQS